MCSMANGLFSYWPQFVASITAAQRILGSAGQSWASFRHHALLSPDPLPSKGVSNHQLGWLDFGTGVRDKGGMESSFLPIQFGCWCMPYAGAGKVTDQPSLPSFPLLFVSVGKIKKVLGGLGTFYFDTISSYKKLQKYTKIFYTLPVCNSVSFFPLSLSTIPQEFSRNVWKDYVWIHDDIRFLSTECIS